MYHGAWVIIMMFDILWITAPTTMGGYTCMCRKKIAYLWNTCSITVQSKLLHSCIQRLALNICDNTWNWKKESKKERKKERLLKQWKNENELPQVGFEPTTLFPPNRCSYQLSYQGSPPGRVQIKHLIHLYQQANWIPVCVHVKCKRMLIKKPSYISFSRQDD